MLLRLFVREFNSFSFIKQEKSNLMCFIKKLYSLFVNVNKYNNYKNKHEIDKAKSYLDSGSRNVF